VYVGVPASALQMCSSDQSISAVILFSGEAKAVAGLWKKLLHPACDSSDGGVHESFRRDSFRESGVLSGPHFSRTDDRRVHCSIEVDLCFLLLDDLFFDFEPLWCLELESRMNR